MPILFVVAPIAILSVAAFALLFGRVSLHFIDKAEQKKLNTKLAVRDENLSRPW